MRARLSLVSLAAAFVLSAAAHGATWPEADERRMAADAASFAPSDFKRQLARHSRRLMQGVSDAAAAETGTRDAAAHRTAAARGARALAEAIRRHAAFDDVVYQTGGIVHELARALPPQGGAAADVSKTARFLGYPAEPFAAPETLAAAQLPAGTARERYDAAVTLSTRLLAWVWKAAGGDASSVTQYPASKGPYAVRE